MNLLGKVNPIILYSNKDNRPFTIDLTYLQTGIQKPVILLIHGFKGFKDWGFFNLAAEYLAQAGFFVVKMNFSHNGTSPEHPLDFVDLDAFGRNNFSIEQDDIGIVLDYLNSAPENEVDLNRIYLVGHSRGGAAAILKGFHDGRIKAVASWAGVNDLANHFSEKEINYWKENGVIYVENSRTRQQMPLYYQMAEDYAANESKLNVPEAIKKFNKPLFIAHGSKDPTVPVEAAYQSKQWNPSIELSIIENADHVFGAIHPWKKSELPVDAEKVLEKTVKFFKNSIK